MRRGINLLLFALASVALLACRSATGSATPRNPSEPATLRLGYFPNMTHTQPIVGLARGTFAERLGSNVKLETVTFNAGPSVIEAMFAGQLDISYVGPNPAVNGYTKSGGRALRIIAGATSGGAMLVVRPEAGIKSPSDLANKKLATPQLGNTQDVALRAYLLANNVPAKENRGSVLVVPTANSDILNLFRRGELAGAWVPEPWAIRLVKEAGGEVFLDEKTLWPEGDFVTTMVIVRTEYLERNPDVVENFLRAHVETTEWINNNPGEAKKLVNDGIKSISGASLPQETIDAAWANQKVTYDPIATSLRKSASDAFKLGYLSRNPDLSAIYVLDPLNKVLTEKGLKTVNN